MQMTSATDRCCTLFTAEGLLTDVWNDLPFVLQSLYGCLLSSSIELARSKSELEQVGRVRTDRTIRRARDDKRTIVPNYTTLIR